MKTPATTEVMTGGQSIAGASPVTPAASNPSTEAAAIQRLMQSRAPFSVVKAAVRAEITRLLPDATDGPTCIACGAPDCRVAGQSITCDECGASWQDETLDPTPYCGICGAHSPASCDCPPRQVWD